MWRVAGDIDFADNGTRRTRYDPFQEENEGVCVIMCACLCTCVHVFGMASVGLY